MKQLISHVLLAGLIFFTAGIVVGYFVGKGANESGSGNETRDFDGHTDQRGSAFQDAELLSSSGRIKSENPFDRKKGNFHKHNPMDQEEELKRLEPYAKKSADDCCYNTGSALL